MLTRGWILVAFLLGLTAAFMAFGLTSGLPPDTSFTLGSSSLRWSLSKTGVLVVSAVAFAVTFAALWLTFAIVAGIWQGLGFVTALIFPILGLPQFDVDMALGLRAALAFIGAAAFVSTVFQNALAILSLAVAFLGLGVAICVRQAVRALANPIGLGLMSRSSAIGGGQSEWRISPALLFSLLALALAGGIVALCASALRPAAPVAAPAHSRPAGGAKEEGEGAERQTSPDSTAAEPDVRTPPPSPAEK